MPLSKEGIQVYCFAGNCIPEKEESSRENSYRMDETYVKVKGVWMYLYSAVDKEGNTIDFLLTRKRNKYAAPKFLIKAIHNNSKPLTINIDKSGANKQAMRTYNKRTCSKITVRQCKYLNNRIEGDH